MVSRDFEQAVTRPAAAPWSLGRTAVLAAVLVAAIQGLLLLTSNRGVLHGVLFDPDCYMHLQRALRLMLQGGWQQPIDPRINAPYGFAIHWTHLFDGLLVLGAEPLRLLGLSPHDALYLWGSAISPVLLMLGLAALAWGVRPWVSGLSFLWLTVLLFTQPQLSGAFLAGRPDHHSLIMALLLAQMAWLYALLDGRAGLRAALLAGICAGLEICTTVEGLLTLLFAGAVLGMAWAKYGQPVIRILAVYLAACVGTMTAWLAAERGAQFFQPAYDRVSIVHVVTLGVGLLCVFALSPLETGLSRKARIVALTLAVAVAATLTALIFPDFFLGPWPNLDPDVKAWHATISELQPLLPTDLRHGAQFLAQFTAALLSIPLIVSGLRRGEKIMLVPAIGLVLFGMLALAQMRWSGEVQAMILLPWTLSTRAIMQSHFSLRLGHSRMPLRSFALMGALLLQILPGAAVPARAITMSNPVAAAAADDCAWEQAILALAALTSRNGTLFTELWYGPEILWRTDLNVIGAPYEIAPALRDTQAAFASETAAHAMTARRGVNIILVCGAAPGFAGQLAAGRAPAWLQPIPAPAGFRLYRVRN